MNGIRCRACGASLGIVFADLGGSPLSNAFLRAEDLNRMEPFYPLKAYVCEFCYLVQVEAFQTPENIFEEYAYFSSYSTTWLDHSGRYAEMAIERFGLDRRSHVIEVASNDGYLLRYFLQAGIPVTGIEPAKNVAAAADANGIPTIVDFLNSRSAADIAASGKRADLLIGNNVFAHVPDLNDFIAALVILLKPEGTLTLEFPHVQKLIAECQFDTIYHEHFSYFSLLSAAAALQRHGLEVFDVEEIPTHGGSLRLFAAHAKAARARITGRTAALMDGERKLGLDKMSTYRLFGANIQSSKRSLLRFLIDTHERGERVVGYGAPAKGNTLLNYCGIRSDLLAFTVDRNPYKQGRYLPGSHIPIYAPERIDQARPHYVLILPWNIRDEIAVQLKNIRNWGGRFVTAIPRVTVF
jgi:SAM-dependent methyltransferase